MATIRVRVAIVGAGFAGLGLAIRLKASGERDFVVLERAAEIGGVWRENTYPGVACDVPAPLYSFSFAPNPNWSRFFAPQREILNYLHDCVKRFELQPFLRLGDGVRSARYDESTKYWRITTETGECFEAEVLVSASGHGLTKPVSPALPGLDTFLGEQVHTARWPTSGLQGARVAVIGTGASAIQAIPELAKQAATLTVFQRTAPWVLPRPDRAIGGREQSLYAKYPPLQRAVRGAIYAVLESFALGFVVDPRLNQLRELQGKAHLRKQVRDPALRERLTPSFRMGCKRVLFSNEYLATFNQAHVHLETDQIAKVTPTGIVTTTGTALTVDAIVFATGFEASEAKPPFAIVGRNDVSLADAWAGGIEAYLGMTISGFPNFFMIEGPNSGLGHSSMIHVIESQINYILSALGQIRRGIAHQAFDLSPGVQARYNEWLQRRLRRTVWATGCQSWYLTPGGKNTTLWPGFTFELRYRTRRFDHENYHVV
jgi:cation diffusion facilitator CzcD-associated flavoprotein CzcO